MGEEKESTSNFPSTQKEKEEGGKPLIQPYTFPEAKRSESPRGETLHRRTKEPSPVTKYGVRSLGSTSLRPNVQRSDDENPRGEDLSPVLSHNRVNLKPEISISQMKMSLFLAPLLFSAGVFPSLLY